MPLFASFKKILAPHRVIPLRERAIFTRHSKLRLRYALTFGVSITIIGISFMSPINTSWALKSSNTPTAIQTALDINAPVEDKIMTGALKKPTPQLNAHLPDTMKTQLSSMMRDAPDILKKAENLPFRRVSIEKGDTIAGALQEAGLTGPEAFKTVKAISEHFNPRHVKSGQTLGLHFKKNRKTGDMEFEKLAMKLSSIKELTVLKEDEEKFTAELHEKELILQTKARFAEIQTSLYGSAARADIPSPIIAEMIRVYSWDIDFQRDIRRGDKVQVLYETYETEDGDFAKYGNVLYASLNIGGKEIPIYRYEMENGRVDYFEPDGTSIRKTLMKTPIDGARISSGFGMRRHPVLGYNKMHKGTDFAAPTGTPIYAAGDGTIDYIGRKGGYGNYIRIRHNGTLKTAYAHMHKFKKGMSKGKRVEQGDVIGYVGSTGRSTGPHLHYEVHVNGKQTNPGSVNLPTGETLAGTELKKFESYIKTLNRQYVSLKRDLKFALFGDPDNS